MGAVRGLVDGDSRGVGFTATSSTYGGEELVGAAWGWEGWLDSGGG